MTTILFAIIALSLIGVTRLISGKWCIGYFAGGLAFGIYNEICFEFCWSYSEKLGPMVWRDVPLIVIFGWSIYTALALVISDKINAWIKNKNGWVLQAFDMLMFFAIGFPIELLMSRLGYWKYNIAIMGVTWMQIYGYFFVALLVSCAGRSIQRIVNKKE